MYRGDSFFTLGTGAGAGLVALSAILAALMIRLAWIAARRRRWPARLLVWAALFTGFLWLSPQIYYLYYRAVIDGLPPQWVIGVPDPVAMARTAVFLGPATLAAHGQGLLGLVMLGAALAGGLDRRRGPNHQEGARDQPGSRT